MQGCDASTAGREQEGHSRVVRRTRNCELHDATLGSEKNLMLKEAILHNLYNNRSRIVLALGG